MDVNFISTEYSILALAETVQQMGGGNASQKQTVGKVDCFMLDKQCQAKNAA
jgi:hypothetical protein